MWKVVKCGVVRDCLFPITVKSSEIEVFILLFFKNYNDSVMTAMIAVL